MKGFKKLNLLIVAAMLLTLITVPASASETRIVFEDDFSRYDSSDELYRSYSCGSANGDLNYAAIEEEEGRGNVLKITRPASHVPQVMKYFDESCNEGVVEFSYSVKPAANITTLFTVIDSVGNAVELTRFEETNASGGFLAFTKNRGLWLGTITPEIWYDVAATVNFNTNKITVALSTKTEGVTCYSHTFDNTLKDLSRVRLQVWGSGLEQSSYYDDIKIKATGVSRKDKYIASTLFSEDFEDGSADGFINSNYTGAPSVADDPDAEHGKLWRFGNNAGCRRYVKLDSLKETGKYGIKFSFKADSAWDMLFGGSTTSDLTPYSFTSFRKDGGIRSGDNADSEFAKYISGIWYDVYVTVDLDNDLVEAMVFGDDGSTAASSKTYTQPLGGFWWQKYGGDKTIQYIDDIEIVENPPAFPEKVSVNSPVYDNFDDGVEGWNFANSSCSGNAVIAESYNANNSNALSFSHSTANNNELMFKVLGKAATMGKVNVSFDVCPGSGIYTGVRLLNDTGTKPCTVIGFDNNVVYAGASSIGNYTPDEWYHCEALINVDKKLLSGKLSTISGIYREIPFSNIDVNDLLEDVKSFGFQLWGGSDSTSFLDNIAVEFEIDDGNLSLSANDVSIYNNGNLQNKNDADINSDKIVIEMGAVMNPQTVPNMIKLVNDNTGKRVKFNGMTDGTKYIMSLIDELAFNTGYTLTVSKNIRCAMNTSLGADFVCNFKTTSETLSLTASNDGFIDIKYNNLEADREMTLIYSCYKNGCLKDIDTRAVVIPSGIYGEFVDTGLFEYSEDFDTVKAMLWDDLGELEPMTVTVERKLENKKLKFDENGEFTVLVVGDPQANPVDTTTNKTMSNWETAREDIEKLVDKVKPDLVIINGDVVGNTGWSSFEMIGKMVRVLEENNIAWATTNGNHDPYNKTEYEIYKQFANNVNGMVSKEDQNYESSRPVNYVLPIYSNDGETPVFAVWGMDSGAEGSELTEKQVAWYKAKSDELKGMNNGNSVTGLMCIHIPLPQMTELMANEGGKFGTLYGVPAASSCANKDSSGMFDALKEKGDIKAIINSHAHSTNLIGSYYDGDYTVLMGFTGKISNYEIDNTAARGGRVIKISENDPENFKTSWVPVLDGAEQQEIYFDGIAAAN